MPSIPFSKHPALVGLKGKLIRAITLDVGGTLIRPWPSVGSVYAACARSIGLGEIPESQLENRFHMVWNAKTQFEYGLHEWKEIVFQCFEPYCSPRELDRLFESAYKAFTQPEAWHVFPDVIPTLQHLKKVGFRLAAVSNWDERLPSLLEQLQLSHYFDSLVVSGIEGCHKPDPALFLTACSRLQMNPAEVLHVGDHPLEDLEGCREAGMQGLLVCRKGGKTQEKTLTDLTPLQHL